MVKTRSVSFAVSDVSLVGVELDEVPYKRAVESLLDGGRGWGYGERSEEESPRPVEACTRYHGRLVPFKCHPLVGALSLAFSSHRPFTLSPDMIWLLVAQGFANHVNANAESLRRRLVSHEGKARILVLNDFVKGSPENPWPEALHVFSAAIREHVGDETHSLLVPRFSTTGPHETAAFEVALMDAMQSYFEYVNGYVCGIPQITLEGETEDWQKVEESLEAIGSYGLQDWAELLRPIIRQFVAASSEDVDPEFWQSICTYKSWSGGEGVTGWINAFFPYVRDKHNGGMRPNPWLAQNDHSLERFLYPPKASRDDRFEIEQHAPASDDFPLGLSSAPFKWVIGPKEYSMEFVAGFVGAAQDSETLGLRPEIGWAVRDLPDP